MNTGWVRISLWWLFLLMVAGCTREGAWNQDGQTQGPPLVPAEEVVRLACTYHQVPWLSFGGDPNPGGLKFNLFLVSKKTSKGVLADGLLQVRMNVKERDPDGTPQRREVCAWTQEFAHVPRTIREFAVGWGYQPHLNWADTDVAGRDIEIVTWYEDRTGRRVYAQTKPLRVPHRK